MSTISPLHPPRCRCTMPIYHPHSSTAATCIRFNYIVHLSYSTDFTCKHPNPNFCLLIFFIQYSPPPPDDVYGVEIWSAIEPGLDITAASATTLRPLLRILVAKVGLCTKTNPSASAGLQILSTKRTAPICENPNSPFGNLRGPMYARSQNRARRRRAGFGERGEVVVGGDPFDGE